MLVVNNKLCTGCGACYNICPHNCISMTENEEGFLYPEINAQKCVDCGLCNGACPLFRSVACEKNTYSAINKDKDNCKNSSSTGIVSEMSRMTARHGGKVVGAVMTSDHYGCVHKVIDNIEELDRLSGSKYVQSEIGDVFQEIKKLLNHGTKILFIGSPCQVAGLKTYLGKDYDTLYTIDFICHGVPSPKVWREYLKQIIKKFNLGTVKKVNFRDKEFGWANYGIRINGEKGEYFALRNNDPYLKAFSRNITLRNSCYNCKFKGNSRYSDITVGDFWGGNSYSDVYDENGTSIIIVHTQKGSLLLDEIKECIGMNEIDYDSYFRDRNRAMVQSAGKPSVRKRFFQSMGKTPEDIINLLDKCNKKTDLTVKIIAIKNRIKRGIHKLKNKGSKL